MEWCDQAVVLSARPHGESAMVAVLLTCDRGRHAGLVHGGRSRWLAATLAAGTLVEANWRGRLAEQLGTLTLESRRGFGLLLLEHPDRLAACASACALCDLACPDHTPHPGLFHGLVALLEALTDCDGVGVWWGELYVRWELGLLAELGYGLDLSRCAVTGAREDLAYVSPRTGRAATVAAGAPYRDRLLALPGFLTGRGPGGPDEIRAGLRLTGHFLERGPLAALHRSLPPARQRLLAVWQPVIPPAVIPPEGPDAPTDDEQISFSKLPS